jgi:arylsulfatase
VLYARGGHNVGHSFFVKDGAVHFDYNALGTHHRATAPLTLAPGRHEIAARFDRRGPGGTLTISADGKDLTSIEIPKIVRMLGSTGLDVGRDALSPVVDDYESPFPFTGSIERITFQVESRPDRAEIEAMARAELAKE